MRGKSEFLLGGHTPLRYPVVHVYDGNRRLRSNDRWAIARAYHLYQAVPHEHTTVLANHSGVIALSQADDSCDDAIALMREAYRKASRRLPIGGVVALLTFQPTQMQGVALAGCGVRVIVQTTRVMRDSHGLEQNFKDFWLGFGARRKRRTLVLPGPEFPRL